MEALWECWFEGVRQLKTGLFLNNKMSLTSKEVLFLLPYPLKPAQNWWPGRNHSPTDNSIYKFTSEETKLIQSITCIRLQPAHSRCNSLVLLVYKQNFAHNVFVLKCGIMEIPKKKCLPKSSDRLRRHWTL